MQVPRALLNPLMSWMMLWVYQLPQSFRAWEWGATCHLPSDWVLASAEMNLLMTTSRNSLAPILGVVISKLGTSQKARFLSLIYWF